MEWMINPLTSQWELFVRVVEKQLNTFVPLCSFISATCFLVKAPTRSLTSDCTHWCQMVPQCETEVPMMIWITS